MTRLLISPATNEDLLSIHEYIAIELSSPKAAKETIGKILSSIKGLVDFPFSGALLENIVDFSSDYRFIVSGNYITLYRYHDDTVYVDRVIYGRRDYARILFDDIT